MLRRTNRVLLIPALVLLMVLASSVPSLAGGPPSFAFEAPSGSGQRTTSSPVLLVHAFSCHQPTDAAVSAHAEGLVNGKRQTIPLGLKSTGVLGVYSVTRQWPADGSWALVFSIDRGGRTTAMVSLDSRGEPLFESPAGSSGRELATSSVRTITGKANEREIETVLAAKLVE
jgi:hypothetical protein